MGAYIALAIAGGTFLALQASINGQLNRALGNPLLAALVSISVSLLSMLILIGLTRTPLPTPAAAAAVPSYAWVTGGMLGALFVIFSVFVPARIGAMAYFALVVLGQMLASLVLDHYGLFKLPVHAISPLRLLGLALLLVGVVLIRRF